MRYLETKLFISKDTQNTIFDNFFLSAELLVISGVLQISILGPILFVIFINNVESCITDPTK